MLNSGIVFSDFTFLVCCLQVGFPVIADNPSCLEFLLSQSPSWYVQVKLKENGVLFISSCAINEFGIHALFCRLMSDKRASLSHVVTLLLSFYG